MIKTIFVQLKLEGAYIIEVERIKDERGFFARSFSRDEFKNRGLASEIIQSNISFNVSRGTLRGMHYQEAPFEEAKLVMCTQGAMHDVIIDLRKDSKTYCEWSSVELTQDNCKMLYIPEGFAHGFQTLQDNTMVLYQVFTAYHPEFARGIRWNDKAFNIKWPISKKAISKRDDGFPDFKE